MTLLRDVSYHLEVLVGDVMVIYVPLYMQAIDQSFCIYVVIVILTPTDNA